MAALTDRLDYVLGKKAAGPLEEHFGIRTVNDLLRHYPRKYSDGMTVLGEGRRTLRKANTSPSSTCHHQGRAEMDEPAGKAGVVASSHSAIVGPR